MSGTVLGNGDPAGYKTVLWERQHMMFDYEKKMEEKQSKLR